MFSNILIGDRPFVYPSHYIETIIKHSKFIKDTILIGHSERSVSI